MICNITLIRFFYHREAKKSISALAFQTLETISQNADNTILIISKTSTYMLGSSDIQNYLNGAANGKGSTLLSRNLRNALYLSLESMPAAESIMILDENGNSECAARYTMPHAILSSPREADWYDEVHRLSGAPIFLINGGGYFAPDGENNYLSLIRLINSIEDVRPLGYMIINIPLDELFSVSNTKDANYSDICVYSGHSPVLQFSNSMLAQYFSENAISELFALKEKEAVIDYLAESSSAPGSYEVYINLPEGTGVPGMSGTMSHVESGEKRPCCVTPAAVTTVEGRSHVYVVREREGILGMEYYAEQVSVRIADQNDYFVALENAPLDQEDRIIISSTKALENGEIVRLSE